MNKSDLYFKIVLGVITVSLIIIVGFVMADRFDRLEKVRKEEVRFRLGIPSGENVYVLNPEEMACNCNR